MVNRVPHFAEARVEMRTFEPAVFEAGIAAMLALNGQSTVAAASDGYACQVKIDLLEKMQPWSRNADSNRLFDIWARAAQAAGMAAEKEERGGLSDGNHTWQTIPTMDGLGPAGANAHSSERSADGSKEQEYVLPGSFVPKTVLNVTALLDLIRGA